MGNFRIGFLFLFVLASTQAFAQGFQRSNYYNDLCSRGYRNDAYARGIEAGFKNIDDLRPKYNYEECYRIGIRVGKNLHFVEQVFNCDGDFDNGYAEGFKSSALSIGTECYSRGYDAGLGAIRSAARELDRGTAGDRCVDEYQRGMTDASHGTIGSTPMDEPEGTCYRTGQDDASSLPFALLFHSPVRSFSSLELLISRK